MQRKNLYRKNLYRTISEENIVDFK